MTFQDPITSTSQLSTLTLLLNPVAGAARRGGEAVREQVQALCRSAGRELRVTVSSDMSVLRRETSRALAERTPVVVGGGDGTISSVAGVLADSGVPLGILPLGSLNHFAKDLGLPLTLEPALAVVLAGHSAAIDLGEVNGRTFVNNSSLGLYPLIVRLREQHPVRGPAKWIVALWATLRELRHRHDMALRIEFGGRVSEQRTPIVFVANNRYKGAGIAAGSRDSLQDGVLAIYVVKAPARGHLLRLAWRVLRDRVQAQELDVLLSERATIVPAGSRVQLAIDGELESFQPPLEYRIRPGSLRVMVPPESAP